MMGHDSTLGVKEINAKLVFSASTVQNIVNRFREAGKAQCTKNKDKKLLLHACNLRAPKSL